MKKIIIDTNGEKKLTANVFFIIYLRLYFDRVQGQIDKVAYKYTRIIIIHH